MSTIHLITNKQTHDTLVAHAEQTDTPTVIYVSSAAIPDCRRFTPKYEQLPERYPDVTFCQMELDSATAPMIKFAPHQTPILILFRKQWCRTLLGGDVKGLEEGIRGMVEKR